MKTKGAIYMLAACFLSSLLILQSGCKKDKEMSDPEQKVVIAENTKVIDQTNWQSSFVSVDSATYTYTFNSNINNMNLKVGDIMVSTDGEGLLRKVKTITTVGSQVKIQTEQATLADVIKEGQIKIDTALTISNIKNIKYHYAGINLDTSNLKHSGNTNLTFDINAVVYDADNNPSTTYDQIRLEGNYSFDWNLLVFIDFSTIQGLKEVKCGFESGENLNLEMIAGLEYNFVKIVDLVTIYFNPIIVLVGTLPVIFLPEFNIKAGIDGYANASITTSIEQNLTFDAGIHYLKDEGWSTYKEFDKSFNFNPPHLNMNAGAEAYLKPELTLKIYGVAGPYANLKLYEKLDADLMQTPWWKLYGGMNMDAGAKAEIFGGVLFDFKVSDLISYELMIAEAPTQNTPPTVTTSNITNITQTTATGGGNVTAQGSSAVTARGVCWNTSSNPTTSDAHTTNGSGTGSFTSNITGLTANTPYYVRAYAMNSTGTAYGNQVSFTTQQGSGGTVTDIDGNVYNTITIGTQVWMVENLKVTHYRNGVSIPNVTDGTEWGNLTTGAYCNYNNDANISTTYGRLYNWYAVDDSRNIAPMGWHVPTNPELTTLIEYLEGESIAGGKLKETGTSHWYSPNTGATNESGFTALPGGCRCPCPYWTFAGISSAGYWWAATEVGAMDLWGICLWYNYAGVYYDELGADVKPLGYSVRCLKD